MTASIGAHGIISAITVIVVGGLIAAVVAFFVGAWRAGGLRSSTPDEWNRRAIHEMSDPDWPRNTRFTPEQEKALLDWSRNLGNTPNQENAGAEGLSD
jgi:hypothetical protein